MPEIFGKKITKDLLLQHVGNLEQIISARRLTYQEGLAKSLQAIEVNNAELSFVLLLDKCLDIGYLSFRGRPLNFLAKPGFSAATWNPTGSLTGKSLMGGMLFTCGLSNVGPTEYTSEGVELVKHGIIRSTPADHVSIDAKWRENEYFLTVRGDIRETGLFESNLVIHRTIETSLGKPEITIQDEIVNEGYTETHCMLLYHFNLGYPLLDKHTKIIMTPTQTLPRDTAAEAGLVDWKKLTDPIPGYQEQVFYHKMPTSQNGLASISVVNSELNTSLKLEYRADELPELIQWKSMASGDYVLGIEPANCYPEGLRKARERGTLKILQPGESFKTFIKLTVE